MIAAKVLVGQTITLGMDSSRVLTPKLPGSERERYDTINNGSGMVIIFTNAKAYPAYLITYN